MKKGRSIVFLVSLVYLVSLAGSVSAIEPVAVSPGSDSGAAVVGQECPTFSWSSKEGSDAYIVEVFESITADLPSHSDIEAMAEPVISREIPAPALSWTPSSGECLSTGSRYVWYVQGIDSGTEYPELVEDWSKGKAFEVDVTLSASVQEAVEGTVNEYLKDEWTTTESYREVKEAVKEEALKEIKETEVSGQGLISIMANEGDAQQNTYYGTAAGASLDGTGYSNAFFGYTAGNSTTGGDDNTFIGNYAGRYNITGNSNTFIGMDAGVSNNTGSDNTFIGRNAGYSNTAGGYNTFIGRSAGYWSSGGVNNTFLGYATGNSNTGDSNTFIGMNAGFSNDTGSNNTFLGIYAGSSNDTGVNNTFLGRSAGANNQTGNNNVFLGNLAGYSETGSNRLYIDNSSDITPLIYGEFNNDTLTINGNLEVIGPDNGLVRLSNVTTDSTVKVSRMVLRHYTNTELPVYLFGAASTSTENFVAFGGGNTIGNAATQLDLFTASNTTTPVGTPRLTIIGNGYVGIGAQSPAYPLEMASGARVTTGGVWTDASSRQYKEEIRALSAEKAMEALRGLEPVMFKYKVEPEDTHVGFIAEDVPDIVATNDREGLSPMDVVAVLTKVLQEQQKVIAEQREAFEVGKERLESKVTSLEAENRAIRAELTERLDALERQMRLQNTVAEVSLR